MFSIERCRQILGPGCRLSDEDIERLRADLYALADIAITVFMERQAQGNGVARADGASVHTLPKKNRGKSTAAAELPESKARTPAHKVKVEAGKIAERVE